MHREIVDKTLAGCSAYKLEHTFPYFEPDIQSSIIHTSILAFKIPNNHES